MHNNSTKTKLNIFIEGLYNLKIAMRFWAFKEVLTYYNNFTTYLLKALK
jgi:hypothetical protein